VHHFRESVLKCIAFIIAVRIVEMFAVFAVRQSYPDIVSCRIAKVKLQSIQKSDFFFKRKIGQIVFMFIGQDTFPAFSDEQYAGMKQRNRNIDAGDELQFLIQVFCDDEPRSEYIEKLQPNQCVIIQPDTCVQVSGRKQDMIPF